MWRRLKTILGGPVPTLDDDEEIGDDLVQPPTGGRQASEPSPRVSQRVEAQPADRVAEAIASVDALLVGPDGLGDAVVSVRDLIAEMAHEPRVLSCAARVLRRVGEEELALGFEAAATNRSADPLVELAGQFLDLDDPWTAIALGEAAAARTDTAAAHAVVADALLKLDDPGAVVARLAPHVVGPATPSSALVRRYAFAAATAEDWPSYELTQVALEEDDDAGWILHVARRARDFPLGEPPARRRDRFFVRYGAVLVDDAPGEGGVLSIDEMATIIVRIAAALDATAPGVRPAWVGARSEVAARWLADALGVSAMPASARLPDQMVVWVLADDTDWESVEGTLGWTTEPTLVVQLLASVDGPAQPVADIIGRLGPAADLPLDELNAERAADRMPPRLLASSLAEQANLSAAMLGDLPQWAAERKLYLSASDPPPAQYRHVLD